MRYLQRTLLAACVLVGFTTARAQDEAPDEAQPADLPVVVEDLAFSRYVDIGLVAEAIASRDASLLTDAALQLAEGERVLDRQHSSGVTAKALLEKAVRLAADNQDNGTLERVRKAADLGKDKELAEQLANLEKLGGATRAIDPTLTISLDALDLNTAIRLKGFLDAIKEAELIGDTELLNAVESQIREASGISDAQRAALEERVKNTRKGMSSAEIAGADPIKKLVAASRGWGIKDLDPTNKNSGVRQAGRDVDRKRRRAIEGAQGGRYTVTLNNPTGFSVGYTFNG